MNHPFAADMIRQAAKRLRADNVFISRFGELQHFGREQPALPHLVAISNNAFYKALNMLIRGRCIKLRFGLDRPD